MHLTRWDRPHTIRDMSDPDIRTMTVRFSAEESRLLEDFARITGVTLEALIREALFLPPLEGRARGQLRLVHDDSAARGETGAAILAGTPA